MDEGRDDDVLVKIIVIITLGVLLLASIVGLTLTALFTNRNLFRPEIMTFGGILLIAAIGGVSWHKLFRPRHRAWRVRLERDDDVGKEDDG